MDKLDIVVISLVSIIALWLLCYFYIKRPRLIKEANEKYNKGYCIHCDSHYSIQNVQISEMEYELCVYCPICGYSFRCKPFCIDEKMHILYKYDRNGDLNRVEEIVITNTLLSLPVERVLVINEYELKDLIKLCKDQYIALDLNYKVNLEIFNLVLANLILNEKFIVRNEKYVRK